VSLVVSPRAAPFRWREKKQERFQEKTAAVSRQIKGLRAAHGKGGMTIIGTLTMNLVRKKKVHFG